MSPIEEQKKICNTFTQWRITHLLIIEIMKFAVKFMKLEKIILSEVLSDQKEIFGMHLFICYVLIITKLQFTESQRLGIEKGTRKNRWITF